MAVSMNGTFFYTAEEENKVYGLTESLKQVIPDAKKNDIVIDLGDNTMQSLLNVVSEMGYIFNIS